MNKKLLICGAIATGLLLTACVKKEPPKEEEQEQVETTTQEQQPTEFKSLDSAETQQDIPTQVQVEREETPNTTTEVRREVSSPSTTNDSADHRYEYPQSEPAKKEQVKTESVKPTTEQTASAKSSSNNSSQSEDDAVAAAIAAATPALKN